MVFLVFWDSIPKRCKGVHCVDLGESFPTRIYLQKSASIQPRTSPSKFGGKIQFNIHFTPYPHLLQARDVLTEEGQGLLELRRKGRRLAFPILQRHAKERHTPLHVGQPPIRRGLKGLDTGRAYSKTGNKDFVGV